MKQNLRKQENGNFSNVGSADKTMKRQEAEIQGRLYPAQASLGYFLAWFQPVQLPSTQPESLLAPKSHVSFKVCTQL
jgi:hypothetical protein